MRRLILSTLLFAAFANPAFADDAHHPPTGTAPGAKAATVKSQGSAPRKAIALSQTEQQFAAAQEQMKKMLAQMEQIRQTKDPKERERLMQDHMKSMHQGAQAMRATGGGMMMEMMDCPMMQNKGKTADTGTCSMMQGGSAKKMEMGQRVDMMERRMDMMQLMMEQMIERERQNTPAPAKLP